MNTAFLQVDVLRRWLALVLLAGGLLAAVVDHLAGLRGAWLPRPGELLGGYPLAEGIVGLVLLAWGRSGRLPRLILGAAPPVLVLVVVVALVRAGGAGVPPTPSAAGCLALLASAASIALQRRLDDRRAAWGQLAAGVPLLCAVMGLLALALRVEPTAPGARLVPTSPVHGPLLLLVGLGLWTLSPGHGFLSWLGTRGAAGRVARALLPAVVVTPPLFALGVASGLPPEGWDPRVGLVVFTGLAVGFPALALLRAGSELHRAERTERAASRALRDREARNRLVIDGLPDLAVVLLDPEGRIQEWSAGATQVFGGYPAQVRHRPFGVLLGEAERETPSGARLLDEARRSGPVTHAAWLTRRDGARFWGWIALAALGDGVNRGFAVVGRDRTAERRVQEAGERADRLLERHRQLEAALAYRGRFIDLVAHEMHGPLEAMIGFAELAKGRVGATPEPELLEALERMRGVGGHLLRLVGDLLDTARVDAGRAEFHLESLRLATELVAAVDLVQPTAEARGQRIEVEAPVTPEQVRVDRLRLRQAVANYLGNAVRVTPWSGTIRVRAVAEPPLSFRVEVDDEGPGLSEAQAGALFRDWIQLDDSTLRGRFGLGLALTRRLVEAQGGEVGVLRTDASGSTFFLRLPLNPQVGGEGSLFKSVPPFKAWGGGDG